MIFRNLVTVMARRGEVLLWVALIAFVLDAFLLAVGCPQSSFSGRIAFGFSKSAACLMTLEAPPHAGSVGYVAAGISWLVSLCGWLLIPVLVAALVARRKDFEHDSEEVKYVMRMCFEEGKIDTETAEVLVQLNFDRMIALAKKHAK
jgi:hypothetical protein